MKPGKIMNIMKYLKYYPISFSAITILLLTILAAQFFNTTLVDRSLAAGQILAPKLELTAQTVSSTDAQLDWRLLNAKAASPFLIYRASAGSQNFVYIAAVQSGFPTPSSYLDQNLAPNGSYSYRITTTIRNATTVTLVSNTVSVTTPGGGGRPAPTPTPTPDPPPAPGTAAGIFVAPDGRPSNNGTRERPIDIATALSNRGPARPGDTIWLRAGVYRGALDSTVSGTAGAPITIRSYPGERAVFDCDGRDQPLPMITVNGTFTHFRDFEVTCTDPDRTKPRPAGLGLFGQGTKLINLVIHDTGIGVSGWTPAIDAEIYGCIIYRIGWQANQQDRGHGHGIYTQNDVGTKRITDNIIFDQYGFGIHAYTENGTIKGFNFDGNTIFGSGVLAMPAGTFYPNILVGGFKSAERLTLTNNYLYHPLNGVSYNCQLYYSAKDNQDVELRNNYIAGGNEALHIQEWKRATVTGNTFVGSIYLVSLAPAQGYQSSNYVWDNNTYISLNRTPSYTPLAFGLNGNYTGHNFSTWQRDTGFDRNGTFQQPASGRPAGVRVFVRPNQFEAGRANITVFNWDLKSQVDVEVSNVLRSGDRFEVRNVQDYFGAPVLTGVYSGPPLKLSMPNSRPGPEFAAFVLTRLSGSSTTASPTPTPKPPPSPTPSPTPNPTPQPTPTPTPSPTDAAAVPLDSEEQSLLELINEYRREKGLGPLGASISLTNAANWHSQDMRRHNYLNGTDSQGRTPAARSRAYGFPGDKATVEENALVALDASGCQSVFDLWKSSMLDNSILQNPHWKAAGVGRSFDSTANRWFWSLGLGAYWDKTILLAGEDAEGRIDRNNLIRTRPPAELLMARRRFSGYGDNNLPYSPVHCSLDSTPQFCWHDPPPQGNKRLDEPSITDNLFGTWVVQSTISSSGIVHADLGDWDRTGYTMELQINSGRTWTMRGYRTSINAPQIESGNWQSIHDASSNEEIVTFTRQNGLPRSIIRIHAAKDQLTFFAVDGGGMMKNFLRGIVGDDNKQDDPQIIFVPKR
jgi:uncharacterized protein YkwD